MSLSAVLLCASLASFTLLYMSQRSLNSCDQLSHCANFVSEICWAMFAFLNYSYCLSESLALEQILLRQSNFVILPGIVLRY